MVGSGSLGRGDCDMAVNPDLAGTPMTAGLQFRAHPSDVQNDARAAAGVTKRLWDIGDIVELLD